MHLPKKLSFILESIDFSDIFQKFQVALRIDDYEWLNIGDFVKTDLPVGLDFGVLLKNEWFENEKEVELKIRTKEVEYFGILELKQAKNFLQASGIGTVFEDGNSKNLISFKCTILIENLMERKSTRDEETQTAKHLKDFGAQVMLETSCQSTSTDGTFIEMSELEKILETTVARRLKLCAPLKREQQQGDTFEDAVEDPKPSRQFCNSFNLIPRMTQLKQLDQMIVEKSEILRDLDRQIEIRRKMEEIRKRRETRRDGESADSESDVDDPFSKNEKVE